MKIYKKKENEKIILAVSGSINTLSSPQLQGELLPACKEAMEVILDFSEVTYISSAGLRVLLLAQNAVTDKAGIMSLRNVSQEVMEVFEITSFTDFLTIL